MRRSSLIFLIATLIIVLTTFCTRTEYETEKFRVVILTDMTHDDGNSLIRFLYYAPYFDLEAMIVTNQLPDFNYDDDGPWDKAMGILDAYKTELPQLRKHDPGFPDYEELRAATKPGRGALPIIWLTNELEFSGQIADRYVESSWDSIYFHDWIGEGLNPNGEPKDSKGSEFLQEVFARDDDRPIFVQAWGGTVTLVQALYRYRQRQGEEKFRELLPRIHLFGILFQDISFEFFANFEGLLEYSCGNFGSAIPTYGKEPVEPGWVLYDASHFWYYVWSRDPNWVKPVLYHEVNGHGPMSDIYDDGGEGDTPSFLYLLSSVFGLNDPLEPTHGSWGSMFSPIGSSFPDGYYHTCSHDQNELARWVDDASNNFKNRLLWSVSEPDEVNGQPVAIVNNDKSNRIIYLSAKPGQSVTLDASASHDPDGDEIRFNWFRYHEADSYPGTFEPGDAASPVQTITIPEDIGNRDIHLVVEVRDTGTPRLVSYRRVVITGE